MSIAESASTPPCVGMRLTVSSRGPTTSSDPTTASATATWVTPIKAPGNDT